MIKFVNEIFSTLCTQYYVWGNCFAYNIYLSGVRKFGERLLYDLGKFDTILCEIFRIILNYLLKRRKYYCIIIHRKVIFCNFTEEQ